MKINKIKIQNYKLFKDVVVSFNGGHNIFVGNNDSGKSTLLEVLQVSISGKLNNYPFDRQLKTSFFNSDVRKQFIDKVEREEEITELPSIVVEIYLNDDDTSSKMKGTNNLLGENCPGINMTMEFNPIYSDVFKKMLDKGDIYDIPIEFYDIKWRYFSGDPVIFRASPFKVSLLDTTKKDYSNSVNKFINSSVSEFLTDEEEVNLERSYRKMKHEFNKNPNVSSLNQRIEESVRLDDKKIQLGIKEEILDAWKNQVSIDVQDIPFEDIGFGSQNLIKMELVLNEESSKSNFILVEEPENNLSFSNMSKLISKINNDESKQVFISTHSSFVANKIGLKNIILLHEGNTGSLNQIPKDTMDFFKKLPGYNTVRFLLANRVILVEGPTDELIVQRAYYDIYGNLPIEEGTDVITVDSLAFKRYCDLALLVDKPLNILTDNDGNIKENINQKYKDYLEVENINFYIETDEDLYSLEPSVLSANEDNHDSFTTFKSVISKNGSMQNKTRQEVLYFMENNKAEWGLRVFDSDASIEYPEYIKNAIKK
ncbi:ATP-dependent nuclease [Virgibacillus natechei]